MRYDRARVMRTAHSEYRATRHKRGVTFGSCLRLAWIVERQRAAKEERERPKPKPTRDIIWLNAA